MENIQPYKKREELTILEPLSSGYRAFFLQHKGFGLIEVEKEDGTSKVVNVKCVRRHTPGLTAPLQPGQVIKDTPENRRVVEEQADKANIVYEEFIAESKQAEIDRVLRQSMAMELIKADVARNGLLKQNPTAVTTAAVYTVDKLLKALEEQK